MAKKDTEPTAQQQAILRKHGLQPLEWLIRRDTGSSLIICHRATKEIKLIEK